MTAPTNKLDVGANMNLRPCNPYEAAMTERVMLFDGSRSELIDIYARIRIGGVPSLSLSIEVARYQAPVQNKLLPSVRQVFPEPQFTLPFRTIRVRRSGRDLIPKVQ